MTTFELRLDFSGKDLDAIALAAKKDSDRQRKSIRTEAWAFQQIRNALGAWSRQAETLNDDGELPLAQQAPVAPTGEPVPPKVLKLADVDMSLLDENSVGGPLPEDMLPLRMTVPVRIWVTWSRNYKVMVAVNRLWHGAFPFGSFREWAEGLVRDAARSSARATEAEEERKLIREVYPELA